MSDYDELLKQLQELPAEHGYRMYESFVLDLLSKMVASEGAQVSTFRGSRSGMHYDAVISPGFPGFEGPVAVEVKYVRSVKNMPGLRDSLLRVVMAAQMDGLGSVLFIHNIPLSPAVQSFAEKMRLESRIPFHLLGLEQLVRQAGGGTTPTVGALALQPLKNALEPERDDWRVKRNKLLSELSAAYTSEGVALFLGAGVSQGANLPSWDELVAGLFVSIFTEQLGQELDQEDLQLYIAAARELNGNSPLLLARYLRLGLEGTSGQSSEEALQERLTELLYKNFSSESGTELLNAIASLAVPTMGGSRVKAVVTYNFDDLLERIMGERGLHYESVYVGNSRPLAENLPILHVHGYLPADRSGLIGIPGALLAFSEEGYHELYRDAYHWSNIAQVNLLREKTCVMLGLSLTDPNLRRLLAIAARDSEQPRHYAFLKRTTPSELDKQVKLTKARRSGAAMSRSGDFLDVHHVLQERVFSELGLQIIWVDKYSEIPGFMLQLRQQGGRNVS